MKKLQLAIMAGTLVMAVQARATLVTYDIAFTDSTAQNVADGTVAVNIVNGLAETGVLTVLDGFAAGSYILIPTPGDVPGTYDTPSGAFFYDDQILGIPPGPPSDPFLDGAGLAFSGIGSQIGTEVNLWGTGPGNDDYTFYGYNPADGYYDPTVTGAAAISLAPVPEATTVIAGMLLLLPLGMSTFRILRRQRMP